MIKETETMKSRNQILIGAGIAVLILASFYILFPFLLVGSPDPLYRIENDDINKHKVVVELFDSHNKTVFIKTHVLDPGEEVRYPKPLLWLLLPGFDGKYTIDITLDGEIRKTREIMIYPWMMVCIDLYDPLYSEEPLTISVITA